jgi:hypothetical protein
MGGILTRSTTGGALAWDPVFGAIDYVVEVGTAPGLSNAQVTVIGSTTPAHTLSGLAAGTYYVRVRPVANRGGTGVANQGAVSNEITVVL